MFYEHLNPHSLRNFLKQPSHETLKGLLLDHTGETDFLDFKTKWIDFTKMAKHILAIANSGGGCVIVGVGQNDDGTIDLTGLSDHEVIDKADIDNKLEHLLPKYLKYRVEDFHFYREMNSSLAGKLFQVLIIEYDPKYVPYTSVVNRNELRYGAIYARQGTKSIEATNEKLVEIILRKVQSGGSDVNDYTLKDHLEQLRDLYEEYEKHKNDEYGKYLKELISRKKRRIEHNLDLFTEDL
ncbi:putative DNA binding domain-containing protein [Bacillus sp. 31A1R]|uniref:DNA binding domain-containing protein n=1 Tax=Robertmurraya mangrovi TaxID=3098077 RepID=A0ABU5J5J2_9BACI|nr:RNA-binding domain-containing protein [Bacillus sp. 31A1R]MDZ5474647.1 putative DNA binding domain-containing protein [Bacillus sp. 31A1R]